MAINIKPKQAFGFLDARNCVCNSPYCQPILTTDSFMIQGTVTAATGIDMILAGAFAQGWTLGAGWSLSGNTLIGTNVTGVATSFPSLGLTEGKYYLIQAVINVTSIGSAGANQGYILKVNDQALALPGGATAYNQDLTATWLFKAGAITTDIVEFSTNESTIDFEITAFSIYELSQPGIALFDGITQVDIETAFANPNSLKYYFNGTWLNTGSIIKEGEYSVTASELTMFEMFINTWGGITTARGCLTARFFDNVFYTNRIRNPEFSYTNLLYWTAGSGWGLVAGKACYSSGGGITALSQTVELRGGSFYQLDFSVNGITPGEALVVKISIEGAAQITLTRETPTTPQYNYIIDLSDETGLVSVEIFFTVATSSDTLCLDDFNLYTLSTIAEYTTNCINIQTEHPCTILLYATNFDNAFGLDYTTGALRHYLRVYGKIKYSNYPEDVEPFKFSDNSHILMFASSEKEYEVIIGDAPEQIHDCIAILRLHDVFQIDSVAYVRNGNYELNRRRSSDNSQAVFTVIEQEGVSSNYSCS